MGIKHLKRSCTAFCLMFALGITACQTSTAPANTADAETKVNKNSAPQRVDIRGTIITRRYDQGQVMLEIEGFPTQNSRYNRAYVLVLPTTQIIGPNGSSISLSELQQGQNVSALLRSGGRGTLVGVGVVRKMWIE